MPDWPTSTQLAEQLAAEGRPVMLAMSRGKDALAAWCLLREHDIDVRPYHLWLIPRLEFVRESLDAIEAWSGVRVSEYPHPSFYRWLAGMIYQAPERYRTIRASQLDQFGRIEMADWEDMLREQMGLPADTWIVDGVRAADSPARRIHITSHGPTNERTRKISVVDDWRIADVRAALARHGAPLPEDYELFGRSFDGLDARFTKPLKDHRPDDYRRVLEWFPLADLDHHRWETLA